MNIKCVTFDLDDTLWAIGPVIVRAETVFHSWLEDHLPDIARRYNVEDLFSHRQEFFSEYPELHHDFTRLRKNWMRHLSDQHGYPPEKVDEGFEVFWKERNNVALFEDAIDVLMHTSENYCTGAITNGNADIHHIGIGEFFDFFLTSARVGKSKPHPEIFEAAVQHAGCDPEQILHVGDDPQRDVEGAARAGMKTVWINTLGESWKGGVLPDAEIQAISELPGILRRFQ